MAYLAQTDLGYKNQKASDGRLRIASQISLGDYKQYLNDAGGQFNTETIGTGSYTYEGALTGGTTLQVSTTSDVVIRQTYQWHNYFAGKPQKIELTASKFDTEANVTKRFGYFSSTTSTPFDNSKDGFYFENDGTEIKCVVSRAGTIVYSLSQSNWLNQSAHSATYDPADFNFYVIEFLYLGGAIVRFSLQTPSGLVKIAEYTHINVDVNTFVKSPNQPIRYEIRSTGGSGTFNHICSDVATEGLGEETGALRTYNTNTTGLTSMLANTRYALLGIRQATASRNIIFASRIISLVSASNDDLLIEIIFGGTTVGTPTWTAIPFTNAEGFKGSSLGAVANAIHSGGVSVYSGYVGNNEGSNELVMTTRRLGSYINGATEELYLCVTPVSVAATAYGAINWLEFI